MAQSTKEDDKEIIDFLSGIGKGEGLVDFDEFYNTFYTMPDNPAEDDVFLGPSCVFTNVINPRSAVNRKSEYKQTIIKKGASIGANATIVCGHDIGEYAFIGAGAVVTKTIPAYALVVGNPAKQIGWVSEYGHRLNFDKDAVAICPETKQEYKLENNRVKRIK
jgi:UDP-2-acetamido-3-amino-2,3-dideoxy-glucuronate N-acetyltransferase